MMTFNIIAEIGDKIRNGDKFIRVRGERSTGFKTDGYHRLVFVINGKDTHLHTCEELLDFIKENNVEIFNKVLINNKGHIEPAETFGMWNDELSID